MKQPFHPTVHRNSPSRAPDWRWQRACWLHAQHRNYSRHRDDELTGRALHYLRALARSRPSRRAIIAKTHPGIWAAHRLREDGDTQKWILEARILARQTPSEIARLLCVPVAIVDAYEGLFFHCRDRLDAVDWVSVHAIGKGGSRRGTSPDPGTILKSFAYRGGPVVLDAVLPYLTGSKGVFDSPLDLDTAAGRSEQRVRLLVALELLPRGAATEHKLQRLMLLLHEMDRKRPDPAFSGAQTPESAPAWFDSGLLNRSLEQAQLTERREAQPLGAPSRQIA